MAFGHRSARRRGMIVGAAISSSRSRKRQAAAAAQPAAPASVPAPSAPAPEAGTDVASEIAKFADLRDKGILTEEEFTAKKKKLLGI